MNNHFKTPVTYWLGATEIDISELIRYLRDTDQTEFLDQINEARARGLHSGEILCSFYAKACYASLTTKKNKNITKVRGIYDNILGTVDSQHGSVFEHCYLNFMVRDCSRIFTHELVRHRAGTSFSQSSGRYIRSDELNIVVDPILEPVYDLVSEAREYLEQWYKKTEARLNLDNIKNFSTKKKLTSALRRLMPNGQANEIGFGVNLRALRHTIELRTSEHAEWEIRLVFNQIYELVKAKFPAIFADAKVEFIDGQNQITFKNKKI